MDYDGFKDIFVANGIYKDLLDRDYLEFYANPRNVKNVFDQADDGIIALIEKMPSVKIPNYAFTNNHDLSFTNESASFGLDEQGFSNGAAYGDLDNDGDLDLVINNINMAPFIYRNEATKHTNHNYLSIKLQGDKKNSQAIGSKVTLYSDSAIFYQELFPVRGFMSTVDSRLNFGLGEHAKIDSLTVIWPDGSSFILRDILANQILSIDKGQNENLEENKNQVPSNMLFSEAKDSKLPMISHTENEFNDFERYKTLFHMRSNEGPKICVGDVNQDGMDDFYMCGAKDSPGALLIQTNSGFEPMNQSLFDDERLSEETDCIFFDADNDTDLDLYVACGSLEFPSSSSALIDKLYLNDGKGKYTKSPQILPSFIFESTSCVRPSDVDQDGDLDLFIGVRMKPFNYGISPNSYLLLNDGKGVFSDVTRIKAPDFKDIGHVTDASWSDIDQDGDEDLLLVGEWMPISVFINEGGELKVAPTPTGLEQSHGWWNVIKPCDVDNDGDIDFIAGNHGRNSRFEASLEFPVSMHVNDFDLNGSVEQMITINNQGIAFPLVMKPELVEQMPSLGLRFKKFELYKDMTLDSIFNKKILSKSIVHHVYNLESSVILNSGDGTFSLIPLPKEAQFSPIYSLLINDWDGNGTPDILIGGNQSRSKPEVGIYNASYGLLLLGEEFGNFQSQKATSSGISLHGEIRDFDLIHVLNEEIIIVAKNNAAVQYLKLSDQ